MEEWSGARAGRIGGGKSGFCMHSTVAGFPFPCAFHPCADVKSTESEQLLFLFFLKVPKEVSKRQQPAVVHSVAWGSCVHQWHIGKLPGGV